MALGFPFRALLLKLVTIFVDAFPTDLRDRLDVWPILVTNEVANGKLGMLLEVLKTGKEQNGSAASGLDEEYPLAPPPIAVVSTMFSYVLNGYYVFLLVNDLMNHC